MNRPGREKRWETRSTRGPKSPRRSSPRSGSKTSEFPQPPEESLNFRVERTFPPSIASRTSTIFDDRELGESAAEPGHHLPPDKRHQRIPGHSVGSPYLPRHVPTHTPPVTLAIRVRNPYHPIRRSKLRSERSDLSRKYQGGRHHPDHRGARPSDATGRLVRSHREHPDRPNVATRRPPQDTLHARPDTRWRARGRSVPGNGAGAAARITGLRPTTSRPPGHKEPSDPEIPGHQSRLPGERSPREGPTGYAATPRGHANLHTKGETSTPTSPQKARADKRTIPPE
jgi:hypothetical protein